MNIYYTSNYVLHATYRALREFGPDWVERFEGGVAPLSEPDAMRLHVDRKKVGRIIMSLEEIETLIAELARIQNLVGEAMIFSQIPIGEVLAEWRALAERERAEFYNH